MAKLYDIETEAVSVDESDRDDFRSFISDLNVALENGKRHNGHVRIEQQHEKWEKKDPGFSDVSGDSLVFWKNDFDKHLRKK